MQICDRLASGTHADLRAALPGIGLVQVVHVTGPESVDEAVAAAERKSAGEIVTDWGLDKLGIEHAPPMITRGVLLDVAGLDGGQFLNPGRAISADELKRAADTARVSIEAGDIALIRAGWGRFFGIDNARYVEGEPGIDVPAARWLTDRRPGRRCRPCLPCRGLPAGRSRPENPHPRPLSHPHSRPPGRGAPPPKRAFLPLSRAGGARGGEGAGG